MTNNSEIKQNNENTNTENLIEGKTSENKEYFKRALTEAIEKKMREEETEMKDIEATPSTRRNRIRMNRWFREQVGASRVPFPEVDNVYERVRSKLIIKLRINKFLGSPKKRRRKK